MSCPECDRPQLWGGMSWVEHTDAQHALYRHMLLKALARKLSREVAGRQWAWELSHRNLVGVLMRSGVYRGLECHTEIAGEFWDDTDRETVLKFLRSGASDWAQWRYGVDVNPATWSHEIYDGRTP